MRPGLAGAGARPGLAASTARRWAGAAVFAVALLARTARADTAPSIDVETWAPSVDPRANLVLEPASSVCAWCFAAGAWLRYENDAVVLRTAGGAVSSRPLENELGLDVAGSLGLGSRGLVGLRLPVALYEEGQVGALPAAAFGDLTLLGKAVVIDDHAGGFGLAALGAVTLPTGNGQSFLSDAGPTVSVRLLAELSGRLGSVEASAGFLARSTEATWPASSGVVFGDAIPWTFGVIVHPGVLPLLDPAKRQSWELAIHGSLPAGPTAPFASGATPLSPALLAVSDRIAFGHHRDGFVLAGVDVGLDQAVGVPSVRAVIGVGWTFASHDRDGDGIDDDRDACPDLPEDFDGFEDADGCPEADNDDDGIIDSLDACPNVPGVASGDPSQNGCPLAMPHTPGKH